MRYIDLTLPEDSEPTYNNVQVALGVITSIAIVGIVIFSLISLISAL